MSFFDFLIYCFNHYSVVSAIVVLMLAGGISTAISHLFYTKHEAEVISVQAKKSSTRKRRGQAVNCVICSKSFYVPPYRVENARYCSKNCQVKDMANYVLSKRTYDDDWKNKIGEFHKGSKSNWWKGGITEARRMRLSTQEWKAVRKQVYARDKYMCQRCKKHCANKEIQAHHIIPWRISKDDSIDNLITLCQACHMSIEHKKLKGLTFNGKLDIDMGHIILITNDLEGIRLATTIGTKLCLAIQ